MTKIYNFITLLTAVFPTNTFFLWLGSLTILYKKNIEHTIGTLPKQRK